MEVTTPYMTTSEPKTNTLILAIESSCDETAASVLVGDIQSKTPKFDLRSQVVHSQIPLHRKYGGVVPEMAARAHVEHILPVVEKALTDAKVQLKDLSYIAVTGGPGLIPSLIVGVEFAKTLSYATGIPLLRINHMEGHLYSAFGAKSKVKGQRSKLSFPIIALIVSGGHTMLVHLKDYTDYKVIGNTVDDAAGEAFDKVAKLLKLPYPGGPEISKLAAEIESTEIKFPRPMLNQKNFDFSFSGLKTAVVNYVTQHYGTKKLSIKQKREVAKAFQDAVVDVLIQKTMRAAEKYGAKTIALSGGVAANKKLRGDLEAVAKTKQMQFFMPDFSLCTDNAGMIAIAAYFRLRAGLKPIPFSKLKADSSWEL